MQRHFSFSVDALFVATLVDATVVRSDFVLQSLV